MQHTSRRIKHLTYSRLYQDRYRELGRSLLVAGMARSGTTWLGSIISSQGPNRLMFEPFNPWPTGALRSQHYILYKRPQDEDANLELFCNHLFSGRIRNSWIDREIDHLFPKGRVVKAVRANLILGWLRQNFSDVSQVLIIRHPCAVVSSWLQLGWSPDRDFVAMLEQPKLVGDFFADKLESIQQFQTLEERIAFVWCANYLVPLCQPRTEKLHIVFYEYLITQPEIEIPKLFKAVNRSYDVSIFQSLDKPSSTTSKQKSGAANLTERVVGRYKNLNAEQVQRVLSVVENFDLGSLYNESGYPCEEALDYFEASE
jgi:hypothetical protein